VPATDGTRRGAEDGTRACGEQVSVRHRPTRAAVASTGTAPRGDGAMHFFSTAAIGMRHEWRLARGRIKSKKNKIGTKIVQETSDLGNVNIGDCQKRKFFFKEKFF